MKRLLIALVATTAIALHAEDAQDKVACEDIVKYVFQEGTNSSFLTKKELTATQKRFMCMGGALYNMALKIQMLERELRDLKKRKTAGASASRRYEKENEEKVRRAVERASTKVKKATTKLKNRERMSKPLNGGQN